MPCFGLDQEEELQVWEAGYEAASQCGYFRTTTKKRVGDPLKTTAFVAGFMYRVFVGKEQDFLRYMPMEPPIMCALEEGWKAGAPLESKHKGHRYEGYEEEPSDECTSPIVQMVMEPLKNELWRPAIGYPGTFVSNCGRIRSWRGFRPARLSPSHKYPHAIIPYGGNQPIHELVAESWLGPKPKNFYLCHNNDIKFDARLSNLRYDTPSANVIDRYKNKPRSTKPIRAKKPDGKI